MGIILKERAVMCNSTSRFFILSQACRGIEKGREVGYDNRGVIINYLNL
jgi:hypothetical protein